MKAAHKRLYIRAGTRRGIRRNTDYALVGSRYAHVEIWVAHHGYRPDGKRFIIHHKDDDKSNNRVCRNTTGLCPNWACGNLALLSRADHIRAHKPGRMGGVSSPNVHSRIRERHFCVQCKREKRSPRGSHCRKCYLKIARAA